MQKLFPSVDGNVDKRTHFMQLIEQLLTGMDHLKDPDRVNLKGQKHRDEHFYRQLIEQSIIPGQSLPLEEVNEHLIDFFKNHPFHTKYFLTNILPMASIPGIIGILTAILLNGNNLWDVYGPAGAEAEVKVVSMMSKLVGYNFEKSGGYTTWGGQGAVFTGLRIAISKFAPDAMKSGVPQNLYTFASEAAHYSLLKSVEATGLGRDKLIKVKTNADSSMNLEDLRLKIKQVVENGGIPIYVVATTGTTDAMGIDDLKGIDRIVRDTAELYELPRMHIHADSALGGFFAFFNDYDLKENPLNLPNIAIRALVPIQQKIRNLHLADSLCFDFQKLGQTPYLTSLFLVKDAGDLRQLDLDPEETPYVGHRGYGQYHTGYTLECSRMASSIAIYSALLAFGKEGYCKLLAQFVEVNHTIREALVREIPHLEIVNPNNSGIITLFRIYPPDSFGFVGELNGLYTKEEIQTHNALNEELFEVLGQNREHIFFGDTKKHLLVNSCDGYTIPLYASKVFVISPYTELKHVPEIVAYLKAKIVETYNRSHVLKDTRRTSYEIQTKSKRSDKGSTVNQPQTIR